MPTEYLKDLKDTIFTYYDNHGKSTNEFNDHFRKVMNEDASAGTFDFDNTGSINDKGRYSDEADRPLTTEGRTFGVHNKKVLSGNRETYEMDEDVRYSEDDGYSDQYIEVYSEA